MKQIIINKTECADGIQAYDNPKTKETDVCCDCALDGDELVCECGQSYGTIKSLIIPKIYHGSFMQNIRCTKCGKLRRFFFWSYTG